MQLSEGKIRLGTGVEGVEVVHRVRVRVRVRGCLSAFSARVKNILM